MKKKVAIQTWVTEFLQIMGLDLSTDNFNVSKKGITYNDGELKIEIFDNYACVIINEFLYYAYEREFNGLLSRHIGMVRNWSSDNEKEKYRTSIAVDLRISSDYFLGTKFEVGNEKSEILCSLSTIYPSAHLNIANDDIENSYTPVELSIENYKSTLYDEIKTIFCNEEYKFYLRCVQFLMESFKSILSFPLEHKEVYVKKLQERMERMKRVYRDEKREQKIQETIKMCDSLESFSGIVNPEQPKASMSIESRD